MDAGVARIIDGADVSSMTSRDLIYMHAEVDPSTGVNSYYAIANPNNSAVTVNFTSYSPSGESAPPFPIPIPAKGQTVVNLPGSGLGGYMRITCNQPVTGLQIF